MEQQHKKSTLVANSLQVFSFLVLWLFSFQTLAAVEFSEDFESGGPGWTIDNGVWEIGTPTSGPGACYSGSQCAGTVLAGNYPAYDDSRLFSLTQTLPMLADGEELHLRFQNWFRYSTYDSGQVQISVWDSVTSTWGAWENVGEVVVDTSNWSLKDVELTAYAGQTVRLGFYHTAGRANYYTASESAGWYIDDIEIISKVPEFTGDFEAGWVDWGTDRGAWQVGTATGGPGACFSGSQCAGTILDGNYHAYTDSHLVSATLQLPSATGAEEVHLRFQNWFRYSTYDSGQVQISVWDSVTSTWGAWENVGEVVVDTSNWSLKDVELTAYAGQTVRLGFYHTAGRANYYTASESAGWYIDDIEIISKVPEFTGDFEAGWVDWGTDRGAWQVGTATGGPGACFSGSQCAGTILDGNYHAYTDSHLVSATLQLPSATGAEEVHLRFQNWFRYSTYDSGQVQISVWDSVTSTWGAWENVGEVVVDTSNWSLKDVELTAYAGQTVRLGFYHTAGRANYYTASESAGWYIDDIEIISKVPEFTGDFEAGWVDWGTDRGAWQVGTATGGPGACFSGSQCAGTILDGNYHAYTDSHLVSATLQLPSATGAEEVHLRFQNWFRYSTYDSGQVQISVWDSVTSTWGAWENVGEVVVDTSNWSLKDVELTAYAGQTVRLGFYHTAGRANYYTASESAGWYIDDVSIEQTGATNHPPVLTLISDLTVNESDTLTIPLSATDPNLADTLSFSVTGPAFVSITENGDWTAQLVTSPGFADAGDHSITVMVTDLGGLSDSQTFTLTVNDQARAPTMESIADQTMVEGATLTVSVIANDPDGGDTLTLSVTAPAFVSIADNRDGTGELNIAPGFDDSGVASVTVTATDDTGLSVSRVFSLYVNDVPPPVPVVAPLTIDFGDVVIGATAYELVQLSNTGGSPLSVSDVASSGLPFIAYPPSSFSLAAGGDRSLSIGFAPEAEGSFSGTITIENNSGAAVSVSVSGRGVTPPGPGNINVLDYLDFGRVGETASLERIVTLTNTGAGPLTVSSVATDVVTFQVSTAPGDILPYTLNPEESRDLLVSFNPPIGSAGTSYNGSLSITSDDPDDVLVTVALLGKAVTLTESPQNNPVLDAQVLTGGVANLITAASCANVSGEVSLSAEATGADSFVVELIDQGGVTASSAAFAGIDGAGTVAFSGIDACGLADGVTSLHVVYSSGGSELPAVPGTPAVKNTSALDAPILDPLDPYSLVPVIEVCGTSRADTTVRIEGGARVVSTRLDGATTAFCLPVTLRQNTENTLIVSAIDELAPAPKPIASAPPVKVVHVDPSQIVIAEAYSRPLDVDEIEDLVASGVISLDEASNFNVSMFTVVLTIGSHQVTISNPVPVDSTPGSISYGRSSGGSGGGGGWSGGFIGGSSGGGGFTGCITNCGEIIVITTPQGQTIPGVIIIDGRIKTLKEFFQVTLLLHNNSTAFVLSDMSTSIAVADGLTTIGTGIGDDPVDVDPAGTAETVLLGEILPGNTGIGQFVVRGDGIGTHAIDVHFDGNITGGGLPIAIPVSGVATTSVEVLGPPQLSVVVRHPSHTGAPDVTENEIYDLIVEITNDSDRPALYTSLELFVGGDALLVDEYDQPIAERSQTTDFGHIQPGETVTAGFRVQSLVEGEIIACQAIAAENIMLTVDTGPDGMACNIVNTYPANFVPLDPDHEPVVLAVNPLNGQVDIPITTSVVAVFTPQTDCVIADTWENVVTAPIDPADPSKGIQVVSADLVAPGTYYLEELNDAGEAVRHVPTDLSIEDPPAGGTTIAVLRLGLDNPHPNSQFFLKENTLYRATILGGVDGVCSASSGKTMGNDFQWIFYTGEGEINNAPVMESIADQTLEEGASLSLAFSATDPDLDALSLSVSGPGFINLVDNGDGTGHLTIEPGYADAGVYNVIVSVTDVGGLTDSVNFSLTVLDINRPPSLDPLVDQVINEGALLSLLLSAVDPDSADTLTLTVSAPAFVTLADIGDGSGSLEIAPSFSQAGSYTITATVTDQGGLSDTQSFSLTVLDVNLPPALTPIADQMMNEGASLSLPLLASDPDSGDVLVFSMNAPLFVTLTDNGDGSGQLDINPGFEDAGIYTVTVAVSDAQGLSDMDSFTLTINNTNRSPFLDHIGDRTVNEGELLSFQITASDQDGDNLIFSTSALPDGAELIDNGDGTAQFNWVPDYSQAGSHPLEFIVSDNGIPSTSDNELITISVGNVNQPPVLDTIGPQAIEENAELSFLITASDVDGDQLSFNAANLPTGALLTDNNDGTAQFSWTPSFSQAGNFQVLFSVTDNGVPIASDSEQVTITIGDVNRPPVLEAIGNQLVNEGEELTFLISASDPDGDSLSLSAGNLPAGGVLTDNGDGTASFSWTPDYGQADNYQVLFIVTDDGVPAASDIEEITITVGDVNRPPVLDPIGNRQTHEGDTLSFTVSAMDPDGDGLSFTANGLPEGATLVDQGNGTALFNWTPGFTQAGNYPVEFVATDDAAPVASDSEEITITIGNINRPPILNPIGDRSVDEGEVLTFILTASDPDGDLLAYTFDALPAGAELIDNGDGTAQFNWLPSTGQAAEYPVSFTVTDTGVPNLSDTEAILIVIEAGSGCEGIIGDLDGDCDVDRDDLNIILAASNTPASGTDDPRDMDGDGMITVNDARQLVLLCTRARCATE